MAISKGALFPKYIEEMEERQPWITLENKPLSPEPLEFLDSLRRLNRPTAQYMGCFHSWFMTYDEILVKNYILITKFARPSCPAAF